MTKAIMKILLAVAFNCVVGVMAAVMLGIQPWIGAVVLNGLALVTGSAMPKGVARVGVYSEIWTGELVKCSAPTLPNVA